MSEHDEYLQVEGNSSGHMIYVCLCSSVSMMVSPRLLFTQHTVHTVREGVLHYYHLMTQLGWTVHSNKGETQASNSKAILQQ